MAGNATLTMKKSRGGKSVPVKQDNQGEPAAGIQRLTCRSALESTRS